MIVTNVEQSRRLLEDLPPYLGTKTETNEIVGGGPENVFVYDNALWIAEYVALTAGCRMAELFSQPRDRARTVAFSQIQRELDSLRKTPKEDELGKIRPSESALTGAAGVTLRMLQTASAVPMPTDISTDLDGDIRILWSKDGRSLELVCPFEPDRRPYIYYSTAHEYAIAHDLKPYRLSRLLGWLDGAIQAFPR
jgi:hypothetical protein